jgi:hypothetical protein
MDENQETVATDLDAAATEAVESQEVIQETEEVQEEVGEQVAEAEDKPAEELDTEGLPQDHKERSDLGRKVSALHRRIDEQTNKFDRVMNYLETIAKPETADPLDELAPDEPITRKEMESILAAREERRETQMKNYNDNYMQAIAGMGADLDQTEYDAVLAEMQNITYDPSHDASLDAERNFYKAERIYLRKKAAQTIEKKVPLKGDKPTGVVSSQKSVVKETVAPKLDAAGQSYVDFVRRRDGDEKANALVKGA